MTDFKHVPIADIIPDPNQPRKYFDEGEQQELAASVKEKGILQPILVRPAKKPGKYTLVSGQRRLRAATTVMGVFSDRNTIPAMIRELTDDEALEIQIIENLQRKDVHPLEEAVAFRSLLEKGRSAEEVAAKVGKSVFYVRQRDKLNQLTKNWQNAFYEGRISNATALKVCPLSPEQQEVLFDENGQGAREININNYQFNRSMGSLQNAPFDINDENLVKKAGACTSCSFNSSVALLFPDDSDNAKCGNLTCFREKCDAAYTVRLMEALEDPSVVLVSDEYNAPGKEAKRLSDDGHPVLLRRDYRTEEEPEKPDWEDFKEYNEDDYDSPEELQKGFEKEIQEFEVDLASYQKKIEGGKYKRAFVVEGSGKGKFIFITIHKGSASSAGTKSSAATKDKEKEGKLTAEDIDAEISRIRERSKRNAEIDTNKIHKETLQDLEKEKKRVIALPYNKTSDRSIMIYLLIENAGYQAKKDIEKALNMVLDKDYRRHGYQPEYFERLAKLDDLAVAKIIRLIAFDKYGNSKLSREVRRDETIMRLIAEYASIDVESIEMAQKEVADKRNEWASKRISELQAKKRELAKPAAKPAAKKAPAKKAAAKKTATKKLKPKNKK